jgi:hypothetical protein
MTSKHRTAAASSSQPCSRPRATSRRGPSSPPLLFDTPHATRTYVTPSPTRCLIQPRLSIRRCRIGVRVLTCQPMRSCMFQHLTRGPHAQLQHAANWILQRRPAVQAITAVCINVRSCSLLYNYQTSNTLSTRSCSCFCDFDAQCELRIRMHARKRQLLLIRDCSARLLHD